MHEKGSREETKGSSQDNEFAEVDLPPMGSDNKLRPEHSSRF